MTASGPIRRVVRPRSTLASVMCVWCGYYWPLDAGRLVDHERDRPAGARKCPGSGELP